MLCLFLWRDVDEVLGLKFFYYLFMYGAAISCEYCGLCFISGSISRYFLLLSSARANGVLFSGSQTGVPVTLRLILVDFLMRIRNSLQCEVYSLSIGSLPNMIPWFSWLANLIILGCAPHSSSFGMFLVGLAVVYTGIMTAAAWTSIVLTLFLGFKDASGFLSCIHSL